MIEKTFHKFAAINFFSLPFISRHKQRRDREIVSKNPLPQMYLLQDMIC